jgi:surfeit locus 1 family protein
MILVLVSLGSWQLYRLSWKLDLINQIENSLKNEPVELSSVEEKNFLRVKTSGKIDFQKQIYLYNLNESGKPGFEVINPILINDKNYLINRGWIPFDKKNKSEINLINQNNIIGTLKLNLRQTLLSQKMILKKITGLH